MKQAIEKFSAAVQTVTGRAVRESEIKRFTDQRETVVAHKMGRAVQISFCDFQTLSGRATTITVDIDGLAATWTKHKA